MLPVVIGLPVVAGLSVTALQALGVMPGLAGAGGAALSDWPGLLTSLALTLRIGVAATALSTITALVIGLCGPVWSTAMTAPLLAVPHAALAVGVGFLIAPTGWLVRLAGVSPLSFASVGDRLGVAVVLCLWLKETPFLLLAVRAALGQADVARSRLVAASLGYAPGRAALLVVLPRAWPQLRLPVLVVLAFSLSVTDVALLLGPQTPPTLAVQLLRWAGDPDLSQWRRAAQASLLLIGLVLGAFGALHGLEASAARIGRHWACSGHRGLAKGQAAATILTGVLLLIGVAALVAVLLWAGALAWHFPNRWPEQWSGVRWIARLDGLWRPAAATLVLASASTGLALLFAIAVLRVRQTSRLLWLALLMPQAGFLFGMQVLLVAVGLDGSALALVWSHLMFVLPYTVIVLRGPWDAIDGRYGRAATTLGASPLRALIRVSLPLLARPLLAAAAIGVSVSATLYLPTLFAGGGRVDTLATVAVSLASGADRRLLAAAALAQAALPMLAFAAAAIGRLRA